MSATKNNSGNNTHSTSFPACLGLDPLKPVWRGRLRPCMSNHATQLATSPLAPARWSCPPTRKCRGRWSEIVLHSVNSIKPTQGKSQTHKKNIILWSLNEGCSQGLVRQGMPNTMHRWPWNPTSLHPLCIIVLLD